MSFPSSLRLKVNERRVRVGFWNIVAFTAQALEMKRDGLSHILLDFFARAAGSYTTIQIR